jgi:hypothetical protein
MLSRIRNATLFALYQTSIAAGIVLLPVAVVLGRLGLTLPVHRLVESLGDALEAPGPNGTR